VNKSYLTNGLLIVTTILGAFGSHLLSVLPQNNEIPNTTFIYGTVSFSILLGYFLIIAFILKNKKVNWTNIALICALLFILSSVIYYNHYSNHYKPISIYNEFRIRATLSDSANRILESLDDKSKVQKFIDKADYLFVNFDARPNWIWEASSYRLTKRLFVLYYILMILFFSISIFALIEIGKFKKE
jgi:hypothetical protein